MLNFGGRLTQYKEGSIHELWIISYPLILSVLSTNIMLFLDRLILAKYDTHAMNAAVMSSLLFSAFQYGTMGIASISEVFVGQYNGAKKYQKIGEPVWQSIWFSLLTSFMFFPLGIFASVFFTFSPEYLEDGVPFFKTLMFFGPTFPLAAALSSFFVGRGYVKLVMVTTVLSNVLNILLDFLLIFGIENISPALGATGAAIATGVAQTVQVFVLLIVFLKICNQKNYGTNHWHFKPNLFWQTLKVGTPTALSGIIEGAAWGVLTQLLASVSEVHITIFSIADNFFVLFAFGFWGLQKGVTTVAANYIGANREEVVTKTLQSGVKIVLIIMLLLTIPLLFFPEQLFEFFLKQELSFILNEEILKYARVTMLWLWLYLMFDAISWLISGVLTASGDTKFVMIMNSVSAWAFSVLPTYLYVVYLGGSPTVSWALCTLYGLLNVISFFLRYKNKRWGTREAFHVLT